MLDALAHAHARGVVHRDIKLSNILLSGPGDARPGLKLSDFGAAHDLEIDESMPEEVLMVGTAYYTPPEQQVPQAGPGRAGTGRLPGPGGR
ncbi:MAG: protein kinase [Proteobacteria bacterium]|nr:protein kinase [Pseudomonadota bacterium]